jgi:hypothetical protein
MINHARTLLLNIFAQSADKQLAGYEYIPVEYRPLVLPQSLKTFRRVLFGSLPDQRFLNLRARELLSYVHQTELAEYLYKLDQRVTYWPEPPTNSFQFPTGIRIRQIRGPTRSVAIGGEFIATNGSGRAHRQYTLTFFDPLETPLGGEFPGELLSLESGTGLLLQELKSDFLDVSAEAINDQRQETRQTVRDGLPTLTLPETDVRVKLSSLITDPDTYVGRWHINLLANPVPAITSLLPTLEILGEPIFLELFGVAPEEPYTTFKNVWFDHPLPAYRLSGLVMALIYRTEQVRRHR